MSLGKVRLDHRVEEGLVDRRQGLGLDFLRGDDLLLVEDDKVEAEMEGVHDAENVTIANVLWTRSLQMKKREKV